MNYAYSRHIDTGFDEAVTAVKDAFKEQGFGVLTEIDVQATLREKLGIETEPYLIIGACNPALAHRALEALPSVGVFLPCNVVVRRSGAETVVEAMDPTVMAAVTGSEDLGGIAGEVAARVRTALDALTPGS